MKVIIFIKKKKKKKIKLKFTSKTNSVDEIPQNN